jgi:hypothetical protein
MRLTEPGQSSSTRSGRRGFAYARVETGLLILLLPQTDLGRSVASFLVDRKARGLSSHAVDSYPSELHYLQACLEKRGIPSVQDTGADLLRHCLLELRRCRGWRGCSSPSVWRARLRPCERSATVV